LTNTSEVFITGERKRKFEETAAKSQLDATVVLENVHDPHNIGAVLRTCDSVGIREVFALYNEHSRNAFKQYVGINSASGALKWVKVHFFTDTKLCFQVVKEKYKLIAGTHLSEKSVSIHEMNVTQSIAFVFGNERDGISKDVLPYLDINFVIPQYGMVQSLNISVACAISLFEMSRQRHEKGMYQHAFDPLNQRMNDVYHTFVQNHMESLKNK
jgi:tRNA (guanosine-2'-O-)-methyltransferase